MYRVVLWNTFMLFIQFSQAKPSNYARALHLGSQQLRYENSCDHICNDLPIDDAEPVCMMFSRYKRGYQFFVNMCHARRSICKENLVLHVVHPIRCQRSKQFFMSMN